MAPNPILQRLIASFNGAAEALPWLSTLCPWQKRLIAEDDDISSAEALLMVRQQNLDKERATLHSRKLTHRKDHQNFLLAVEAAQLATVNVALARHARASEENPLSPLTNEEPTS